MDKKYQVLKVIKPAQLPKPISLLQKRGKFFSKYEDYKEREQQKMQNTESKITQASGDY